MIIEDGGLSKFHREVLEIVGKMYPNDVINTNYHFKASGKSLYFDIYIPRAKIVIEADGRQHYEFVEHYHGDAAGFQDSKKNDIIKNEFCKSNNLTLVRILYNEQLDRELIQTKIIEALKG